MSLTPYLKKLVDDPLSISRENVKDAINIILHSSEVSDLQIAAFLAGCRVSHRDHQPDFIAATVSKLQEDAKSFDHQEVKWSYLDIVGTGGDGQNTFNVSTTAAIVAAGVPGIRVAKHGGPASTSASGASDLLGALGIDVGLVTSATAPELLNSNSFVYMSGPVFHPVLAKVRAIRKSLGIPTIFNIVGPLLNPAPISARVLGVYTRELGPVYAAAARELFPGNPALVVWGHEGLDELSIAGPSSVWFLKDDGSITETTVTPADFGVEAHPLSSVASGPPAENASVVYEIINGKRKRGDPHVDYVLINCAALLVVCGAAKSWEEGANIAWTSIESKGASEALSQFAQHTKRI